MTSYIGYGAAKDSFYRADLRPNPECADNWCRRRQTERRTQLRSLGLPENSTWDVEQRRATEERAKREAACAKPKHEDNEFNIELASDSDEEEIVRNTHKQNPVVGNNFGDGIRPVYRQDGNKAVTDPVSEVEANTESLEELMARMKQL